MQGGCGDTGGSPGQQDREAQGGLGESPLGSALGGGALSGLWALGGSHRGSGARSGDGDGGRASARARGHADTHSAGPGAAAPGSGRGARPGLGGGGAEPRGELRAERPAVSVGRRAVLHQPRRSIPPGGRAAPPGPGELTAVVRGTRRGRPRPPPGTPASLHLRGPGLPVWSHSFRGRWCGGAAEDPLEKPCTPPPLTFSLRSLGHIGWL